MAVLDLLQQSVDFYFACLPRQCPQQAVLSRARVIAHRGAHRHRDGIIENTMAAFQRAFDYGCWGIELDIHATRDGVLLVNHDPDLRRLWGKNLKIADLGFDEIRQLCPDIPSLEEVIREFGKKMHLFIELKHPFTAEALLIEQLAVLSPVEDYHLLSLDEPVFAALEQFSPEVLLLVASHNNVSQFCESSLEHPYAGVLGHYLLFRQDKIRALQDAGQLTGVGFVDSKNSLYRELNRGLTWLFTNRVERVMSELGKVSRIK